MHAIRSSVFWGKGKTPAEGKDAQQKQHPQEAPLTFAGSRAGCWLSAALDAGRGFLPGQRRQPGTEGEESGTGEHLSHFSLAFPSFFSGNAHG